MNTTVTALLLRWPALPGLGTVFVLILVDICRVTSAVHCGS